MKKYNMLINGKWVGEGYETIDVTNPANDEVVGRVPYAGEKETNEAIDAAHHAFTSWSGLTAYERADYLKKLYQLMLDHQEELAEMMTLEMGKPIKESRGEVQYAASFLEWYAEEGKRIYG